MALSYEEVNVLGNLINETYGKTSTLKMKYIRTPKEIWDQLKKEFKFTVDACASDKNHLVDKYFFLYVYFIFLVGISCME